MLNGSPSFADAIRNDWETGFEKAFLASCRSRRCVVHETLIVTRCGLGSARDRVHIRSSLRTCNLMSFVHTNLLVTDAFRLVSILLIDALVLKTVQSHVPPRILLCVLHKVYWTKRRRCKYAIERQELSSAVLSYKTSQVTSFQ